jgi:hypothetical protein
MRTAVSGVGGVALLVLVGCAPTAPAQPPPPTMVAPVSQTGEASQPSTSDEDDPPLAQHHGAIRDPLRAPIPTPIIHIRMHAIVASNDDGSEPAGATVEGIVQAVQTTNAYLEQAGIVVELDPRFDFEPRRGTLINYDCVIPGGWVRGGPEPRCEPRPCQAARENLAAAYPRKMVVFFRSFNNKVTYDGVNGFWRPGRATGGFSGSNMPFVVAGPGAGDSTFLAHEIGHYLHLPHPFVRALDVPHAAEMIRRWVEEGGHPVADGLGVFDHDRGKVNDTPPDAAGSIFKSSGLDPCGPVNDIPIPVRFSNGSQIVYTLSPNRHNIMSYFKGCPFSHDFSPGQIARMRDALLNGNRRNVVASLQ